MIALSATTTSTSTHRRPPLCLLSARLLSAHHTMSSFSRVLLRTSRSAVQYQRGANPLQNALGAHGTARWLNGVRNYAAFTRDKPHVNIGLSRPQSSPCVGYSN